MAEGTVLFVRGGNEQNSQDEDATDPQGLWDDAALVKAYDRALKLAREVVAKRMSFEEGEETGSAQEGIAVQKQSRKKRRGKKEVPNWDVGSPCCARYSVDGVWYEGTITTLLPETQSCIVKYVGSRVEPRGLTCMLPFSCRFSSSAGNATHVVL